MTRRSTKQPGKIIHEYRPVAPDWMVDAGWPVRDGEIRYYGTSDATSWFLVVLAATGDAELQEELSANREAAGRWLESALAAGRGFVRCGPRQHPGGLAQQGWRDAGSQHPEHGNGIVTERGTAPAASVGRRRFSGRRRRRTAGPSHIGSGSSRTLAAAAGGIARPRQCDIHPERHGGRRE